MHYSKFANSAMRFVFPAWRCAALSEQLLADDAEIRALRAERMRAKREKRALVAQLLFDGMTTKQVAERLGITRQAISQMARRNGFPTAGRGVTLRVTSRINCHLFPKFASIAEAAGQSTGAYLARMIKVATEDPEGHRRYMGRAARPGRYRESR